jgi:hypothetical protein
MARKYELQLAELHIHVALRKRFRQLGRLVAVSVGKIRLGLWPGCLDQDSCNKAICHVREFHESNLTF